MASPRVRPEVATNLCAVCYERCKTLQCGRCRSVVYCSVECQKRDWTDRHRAECEDEKDGGEARRRTKTIERGIVAVLRGDCRFDGAIRSGMRGASPRGDPSDAAVVVIYDGDGSDLGDMRRAVARALRSAGSNRAPPGSMKIAVLPKAQMRTMLRLDRPGDREMWERSQWSLVVAVRRADGGYRVGCTAEDCFPTDLPP